MDAALARKYGFTPGDGVEFLGHTFKIAGLSADGTNCLRVLKAEGLLVVCFRPGDDAGTEDFPSTVYRFCTDAEVTRLLRAGGFDG